MPARISRRQLANYAAVQLLAGNESVLEELAALLITERREREADLLVRDIEMNLAEQGEMVLTVETARPIDQQTEQQIGQMFNDRTIHIRQVVRPELIGGLKVSTPSQVIDVTLAKQLADLRAMKV